MALATIENNEIVMTRSPGTTSVCFSVIAVNDAHRKPEFKIKFRD